jgi:DUF1365 family protein
MHARLRKTQGKFANRSANHFAYPLCFVALPLDAMNDDESTADTRWFGFNRRAPLAVHARDHGPCDGSPLLPWIRDLLAREGITAADGEVVLQTFPRTFGLLFNPVSFWFCHDVAGNLRAVLAEVRNTFGERHNYLVAHPDQDIIRAQDYLSARKVFHVSPFFPVSGEYRFRFDLSAHFRRVDIDYFLEGERTLVTFIEGTPAPLNKHSARRAALHFPLLAVGVIWRIHWQALRLWLKGAFLFRKPALPLQETTR